MKEAHHCMKNRSNCTFMELKLESGVLLELAGGSSNCTFMELKSQKVAKTQAPVFSSNCTFMELKCFIYTSAFLS